MRNYVIINGVNSLNINGLAINELPPITKPPMRTLIEEIDGRDGDIITDLGYGAYDKEMSIGLFQGYDIDEIIAFFNGEGTIIFSNEPDKYYKFKIVEQIDYEKLLKFKTAIITLHCQPFKYKVDETPIEVEYQYIEETGTNITLNNTADDSLSLELNPSELSQETTTGKNKLGLANGTYAGTNGGSAVVNNGVITINGTATNNSFIYIPFAFELSANTQYSWSANNPVANSNIILRFDSNTMPKALENINETQSYTVGTTPITTTQFVIRIANGTTLTNFVIKPQLEVGTPTSYEPYTGGIPSPNPDYPSDIHVITGDNTIKICGKNIASGLRTGVYNATTGIYTDNVNYTCGKEPIYIKNGANYIYSIDGVVSNGLAYEYDKNGTYLGYKSISLGNGKYSPSANAYYFNYAFSNGQIANVPLDSKVQIEYDEDTSIISVSPYEEYQSQTKTITLGDIEYCNINDTHKDNFLISTGKNKLPYTATDLNETINSTKFTGSGGIYTIETTPTSNASSTLIALEEEYTIQSGDYIHLFNNVATVKVAIILRTSDGTNIGVGLNTINRILSLEDYVGKTIKYIRLYAETTYDGTKITLYPMIIKSSALTTFEPYGVGVWYLQKNVGKDILDENSNWIENISFGNYYRSAIAINGIIAGLSNNDSELYSNYFYGNVYALNASSCKIGMMAHYRINNNVYFVNGETSVANWKTWVSTHNIILYYRLNTPQYMLLNDTLQEELEDIRTTLVSYKGQTNISQINDDLAFMLTAIAREEGSDTGLIVNQGNIYSKPTLDIKGSGDINVSLNGSQLFIVDVEDEVVIDSANLEAYNPNTGELMNRNITGNISNLKLNKGTNTMVFSGNLEKATITDYSRWL